MKNLIWILLGILPVACVKDKPPVNQPVNVQLSNSKKVYLVNEGTLNNNNASISLYDPGTAQVVENIYQSQNNGVLGDIAQSITHYNSAFYIVVNNSGKVVICDDQFKYKTSITGLVSPRYFLPITNSKAYVSDLYSNKVSIVNLNNNTVTGNIYCPGWTEKMALIYDKAFVTNMYRKYLYVINTSTDSKADSVDVGPNAGSVLIDKNDFVWTLSSGDPANNINATLRKINPVNLQVEKTLVFNPGESPFNLCLNKTKDTLYFLNNGIYRISISDNFLPASPFIAKGNKNFYGLGVNPVDCNVYAADALDYIQKSNIYIYSAAGASLSNFKAGINSSGFYFE